MQSYFSRTYYLLYSENQLILYRVHGQRVVEKSEFVLPEPDDIAAGLALVTQQCSLKTDDRLIVGLPVRFFNFVSFSLPLAAAESLDEAIHYELTRHIPYDLDSCLFHYDSSSQEGLLQIRAVVALKDPLLPYLAALTASGLSVSAITSTLLLSAWMNDRDGIYVQCPTPFAEFLVYRDNEVVFSATTEIDVNSENSNLSATLDLLQNHGVNGDPIFSLNRNEAMENVLSVWSQSAEQIDIEVVTGMGFPPRKTLPYKIELASEQVLRKRRINAWLNVAVYAIFFLSLLAYPVAFFAGKYAVLRTLDEQLVVVQKKAETLDALRQDNQTMNDRYERLATHVNSQPQVVDILKEITDVVSNNTWLGSLKVHDRNLTLRGTSTEATNVIESLSSSPLFSDVHFGSPVVKKGSEETFTIVATIK